MLGGARAQRVRFRSPIRYRWIAESEWHFGDTVDISGSGLLFLCETPLEVGTEVEVILPAKAQQAGNVLLLNLTYRGRVVRRVLANWPDVRPAVAIRISHCQIAPRQDNRCSNLDGVCCAESKR